MQKKPTNTFRLLGIALVAILAAVVVFSSYTIVNPGMRGVVVMLGKVEKTTLAEGFHLIVPPVLRQVVQIDVRTKKLSVEAEAASSDLQILNMTGVLNYHLDPVNVHLLYQQVGLNFESIIIEPAMHEAIKAASSGFRVERILAERSLIRDQIQEYLSERLGRNYIIVDQFSLANVDFSVEFNNAIERKQVAEQAALQKQYELQSAEKDVEIALARAEGEKRAAIIAAEGRAEARRLEAQVEAEALKLIGVEIAENPDLIRYEWASKLSPTVNTVLLPADQEIILDSQNLIGQ